MFGSSIRKKALLKRLFVPAASTSGAPSASQSYSLASISGQHAHQGLLKEQAHLQTLEIDEASRRSLEITRTLREGRREGSLLAVLDRTVTAMGSRMLRTARHKYAFGLRPRMMALYDLEADADQYHNLWSDPGSRLPPAAFRCRGPRPPAGPAAGEGRSRRRGSPRQ